MNRFFIITILLIFGFNTPKAFAQSADKTVTLTSSGIGRTQDEAKQNALRSAIEQAFGTFISSKTEILNDELVKDEIVSVSNGNIQSFKLISEVQLPDNNWNTTLNATVSVTKLSSFVVSKGGTVEFNGAMMAFNLNQQKLNETNEIKAMDDMMKVVLELADNSFDFEISASDPTSVGGSADQFWIPLTINVKANHNFTNISKIIHSTLKGVTLTKAQADDYIKLQKYVYPVSFAASEKEVGYFILRTEESLKRLLAIVYYFNKALTHFKIANGVDEFTLAQKPYGLEYIYDKNFRVLLKNYINGQIYPESVFYVHMAQDIENGFDFGLAEFTKDLKDNRGENLIKKSGDRNSYYKLKIVENYFVKYGDAYHDDNKRLWASPQQGQLYFLNYNYWLQEFPDRNEYGTLYRSTGLVPQAFYVKYPYGFPEYVDPEQVKRENQKKEANVQLPGQLGKIANDFNAIKNSFSSKKQVTNVPPKEIPWDIKSIIQPLTKYKNKFPDQFTFLSNLSGYEAINCDVNYQINGYEPFRKFDIVQNSYFEDLKPEEIREFLSEFKILEAGIVISFSGIKPGTQVVRYDYYDIRTIDEINQMKGYSVIGLGNYSSAASVTEE